MSEEKMITTSLPLDTLFLLYVYSFWRRMPRKWSKGAKNRWSNYRGGRMFEQEKEKEEEGILDCLEWQTTSGIIMWTILQSIKVKSSETSEAETENGLRQSNGKCHARSRKIGGDAVTSSKTNQQNQNRFFIDKNVQSRFLSNHDISLSLSLDVKIKGSFVSTIESLTGKSSLATSAQEEEVVLLFEWDKSAED